MLLFLVTPCLVRTVQPCMKWIPTFKKWSPTTYLIPNDKKNTNEVSEIEKVYITFHTHQTSGMCAGSCTCNHIHQMVKTDKSVIQLVFKCVPLRPLLCKSLFCVTLFHRIMMLNAVVICLSLLENTFYWMIVIVCRRVLSPTWKANSHVKWHNLSPGKAFSPT